MPGSGVGDYRDDCIRLWHSDGSMAADFRYVGYEILAGSYRIPGLPALHDSEEEQGQTLVITLKEVASQVMVCLYYGVFEAENVITRAVRVENQGKEDVILDECLSCCLDFQFGDLDMVTFAGRHAMERGPERNPVGRTRLEVGSVRGTSSHQYNPAVILCSPPATEDFGDL